MEEIRPQRVPRFRVVRGKLDEVTPDRELLRGGGRKGKTCAGQPYQQGVVPGTERVARGPGLSQPAALLLAVVDPVCGHGQAERGQGECRILPQRYFIEPHRFGIAVLPERCLTGQVRSQTRKRGCGVTCQTLLLPGLRHQQLCRETIDECGDAVSRSLDNGLTTRRPRRHADEGGAEDEVTG